MGVPVTFSGVEQRILRRLFSPEEARAALALTHRFESMDTISERAITAGMAPGEIPGVIQGMVKKGTVFARGEGADRRYSLVPYVVGMYEFQLKDLTAGLYDDTVSFMKQGFAADYLTTAVPQMRVIPVNRSVTAQMSIATYDEIRALIEQAGERISVAACICKKAQDIKGEPCAATEMRELCIALRDYSDTYRRQGWGKPLSSAEALTLLDKAERQGLVLQTSNEQVPQFVCACCGCCCGILGMVKFFPRPADFVAGNYCARLEAESCTGCGLCAKRCPMEAVIVREKKATLKAERCIGCGVCVAACKPGALRLERKEKVTVPPRNTDELYDVILKGKKSRVRRLFTVARALMGFRIRD